MTSLVVNAALLALASVNVPERAWRSRRRLLEFGMRPA
jgi:hypothetical protein